MRENLFNILQNKIQDSTGLDLFAGTGAIGIEALSKGAKKVFFVEKKIEAFNIIKDNLNKTNFLSNSFIFNGSWNKFLNINKNIFDWIYIDPPYDLIKYKDIIKTISHKNCLKLNGLLIIETNSKELLNNKIEKFICYKSVCYGNSILWFYKEYI